jgi:mono/diheme cytochrome c family protein
MRTRAARSALAATTFAALAGSSHAAVSIDFNRDIRPVLSNNCLACHGPDEAKRKAGLRLDQAESATAIRDGSRALDRGHPESSALLSRVLSPDPEERMPPPDSG